MLIGQIENFQDTHPRMCYYGYRFDDSLISIHILYVFDKYPKISITLSKLSM